MEKSVTLFKESVKEDFQNRSKELTEKLTSITQPATITSLDSSIFKSETIEIKTPILQNQSVDEKMTDFLQSVLAVKNPINVYLLDTIFQQKLKEKNIHIATAICLTDTINKKNNSCTRFNIASFIPLFTEPYLISSVGISLKAYIKIPRAALIRRMPTLYWIALLGWFLFTSSIGFVWYNLRKKNSILIKDSAEKENALQDELIQKKDELEKFKQQEKQNNNPNVHVFSPYLIFEKDTKTLRHHGEIVKLTLQQQQLLSVFCNAQENTCSINDLCNQVWKGRIVEENTIQQAISRLNVILKMQKIHIQYEFRDSYKLMYKENE